MRYEGQLAFTLTSRSETEVVGEMPVQPGLLNPFGTVHAGAMIWFADVVATTLAIGGATEFKAGMQGFPLAINLVAQLVGNQKDGALTATARFVKKGRSVCVVRTLVTGAEGRLLADVTTSHVFSK